VFAESPGSRGQEGQETINMASRRTRCAPTPRRAADRAAGVSHRRKRAKMPILATFVWRLQGPRRSTPIASRSMGGQAARRQAHLQWQHNVVHAMLTFGDMDKVKDREPGQALHLPRRQRHRRRPDRVLRERRDQRMAKSGHKGHGP
jgi:hypothetical protein